MDYHRSRLRLLRFLLLKGNIIHAVLIKEQFLQIGWRLAGNILHGNALADVGSAVRMALRGVNIQIPDELVVNDKALGFYFCPLPASRTHRCGRSARLTPAHRNIPAKEHSSGPQLEDHFHREHVSAWFQILRLRPCCCLRWGQGIVPAIPIVSRYFCAFML